jgi:hypothetical protein
MDISIWKKFTHVEQPPREEENQLTPCCAIAAGVGVVVCSESTFFTANTVPVGPSTVLAFVLGRLEL